MRAAICISIIQKTYYEQKKSLGYPIIRQFSANSRGGWPNYHVCQKLQKSDHVVYGCRHTLINILHCPRFLRQGDPKKKFGVKKMWRKKMAVFTTVNSHFFTFLLRQPGVKKENPEIY